MKEENNYLDHHFALDVYFCNVLNAIPMAKWRLICLAVQKGGEIFEEIEKYEPFIHHIKYFYSLCELYSIFPK